MHGEGKQMLREHIKNKRASEGLQEIPTDLFAKKPRYEMTEEEHQGMLDRRQRNKEAAERSRKKRKVEMEKLQTENDQLKQDNCELVAIVYKLKMEKEIAKKEKESLRNKNEQLLHWIGKKCNEFGLTKYAGKDVQSKGALSEQDNPAAALTHTDPLLNTGIISDKEMLKSVTPSPSPKSYDSLSSKKTASFSSPSASPRACGIVSNEKIARSMSPATSARAGIPLVSDCQQLEPHLQLQTPWLMEPVAKKTAAPECITTSSPSLITFYNPAKPSPSSSAALTQFTAQPAESHLGVMTIGQQMFCIPSKTIIVIQEGSPAVVAGSSAPHYQIMISPGSVVDLAGMNKVEFPMITSSTYTSSTCTSSVAKGSSGTTSLDGGARNDLADCEPRNDNRTRQSTDEGTTTRGMDSAIVI